MSQIFGSISQSVSEVKTHTVDFSSIVPTGGSITAGTAIHTPPGGGTATAVTCTVTSPYVFVKVGPLNSVGVNYVDVLATLSNGDKASARLVIDTFYQDVEARSGMADIIAELRSLTETSANDYAIGNAIFWSDKQLQDILDRNAFELENEMMQLIPTRKTGGYSYTEYYIGRKWIEQDASGTSLFKVRDATGAIISTSLYTVDYNVGEVSFNADQVVAVNYFVDCYSYDIMTSAADIWRKKMVHYASAYNFSTDNHSVTTTRGKWRHISKGRVLTASGAFL
jgi:hypothetical protein